MIKAFRVIGLLEGISYLLLLGIAVPIKYLLEDVSYVKMLGMPHGLLFVAYIVGAFVLYQKYDLSTKTLLVMLAASIIPFGTFYVDKKYLKDLKTA